MLFYGFLFDFFLVKLKRRLRGFGLDLRAVYEFYILIIFLLINKLSAYICDRCRWAGTGRADCNIAAVLGHKFGNWTLIDGAELRSVATHKTEEVKGKETTANILKQLLVPISGAWQQPPKRWPRTDNKSLKSRSNAKRKPQSHVPRLINDRGQF